ncbi:MAG: DNA repair protein RecN [Desulfobacterota bacterium]|nr:DNA repair protein RecN [Thermodesulfobacteriota bacterium]
MLQHLFIKDFALINAIDVSFHDGLTIITGETGAGKSIIVGALNLLIGGRASADLIRTGAEEARVEAVFNVSGLTNVQELLRSWDMSCDGGELLVSRSVSRTGKNKIMIAGRPATLQMLTQLGSLLLDISGQYSQQLLLHEAHHIDILDGFANLEEIRQEYETLYATFLKVADQLRTVTKRSLELAQRKELLEFQYQEIARADLRPGEEELLLEEKKVAVNARMLQEATYGVYARLYEDEQAVVPTLQQLAKALSDAAAIDHTIAPFQNDIRAAAISLEDCARSLCRYAQNISIDPRRLEDIEERLAELYRLKKKYGQSIEDILAYHRTIEQELAQLHEGSSHIDTLTKNLAVYADRLWSIAESLTQKRIEAGKELKQRVEAELADIGFRQARFTVAVTAAERVPTDNPCDGIQGLTTRGRDSVQFFIAPNTGESEKPLSRIASGGELSRIVLAIKKIVAQKYSVATLVFDEVDAGIGGAVAEAVGMKLRDIARQHQVICITHVPQIAVFGSSHFTVTKTISHGRTVTSIAELTEKERPSEIARMLGGKNLSAKTLAHAREMLNNARRTSP